jgi:ElaB/YqjD/DUF883 family membrane-anchored ribosome-binding protein
MNKDQVEAVARNLGGAMEEVAGSLNSQVKTGATQAASSAQEAFGEAKEAIADSYMEAEDTVRDFIEKRPYTTAAIMLGVGLLIGSMGRSRY